MTQTYRLSPKQSVDFAEYLYTSLCRLSCMYRAREETYKLCEPQCAAAFIQIWFYAGIEQSLVGSLYTESFKMLRGNVWQPAHKLLPNLWPIVGLATQLTVPSVCLQDGWLHLQTHHVKTALIWYLTAVGLGLRVWFSWRWINGWLVCRPSWRLSSRYVCNAWPQWSALFCSASIPAATQEPPSHCKTSSTITTSPSLLLSLSLPVSLFTVQTYQFIRWSYTCRRAVSVDWRALQRLRCVIYPLPRLLSPSLSLSRDEFTAQNRGQGGCTNWNSAQEYKSVLTADKSDLIHRSFQSFFRWGGNPRMFFCSLSASFSSHTNRKRERERE